MNIFRKLLIAVASSAFLTLLVFLLKPETAFAQLCPWGLNSLGTSSFASGLIVKTVDTGGNPINGITFTLNSAGASILQTDASGELYSHVSSVDAKTGDTIFCGPLGSETSAGVSVFGFGSSKSGGNHWVLGCRQVDWIERRSPPLYDIAHDNGIIETYWLSNIAKPGAGDWTGDPGNFSFPINGGNREITLTWHDAPQTGTIQGFKVNPYSDPNISPIKDQTVRVDTGANTTANPFFLSAPAGNRTVSVDVPSGWTVGYIICNPGCNGPPTPGNSVTVNVASGGTVDMRWVFNQPPIGSIDTVTCDQIAGWARDNDTNDPIKVRIYAGGVHLGDFTADAWRGDGEIGFHGYGISVPDSLKKDNENRTVAVEAFDSTDTRLNTWLPSSGTSLDLKCPPGTIQGFKVNPYGNTNFPASGQNVHVVGGDSTTQNPFFLSAPAGNRTVSVDVLPGWAVGYIICNPGCNGPPTPGNSVTVNVASGGTVDMRWVFNQPPIGNIDRVDCDQGIAGWAKDNDIPNDPIKVRIYAGSVHLGDYTADGGRDDVGNHGYGIPIPDSVKDGATRRIAVEAFDSTDTRLNTWLPSSGTSLDLNCPPGTILGRIWIDVDGDGRWDQDGDRDGDGDGRPMEKFLRDPDSTVPDSQCTNFEKINGSSISFAGPENPIVEQVLCNTQPHYSTGLIMAGNYSVKTIPPPGWIVTGVSKPGDWTLHDDKSVSGRLPWGGERHIWFGIGKLPTCTITATPSTITAGETTIFTWTTTDATGATLGTEGGAQLDVTHWLPSASSTLTASETITLIMTVTNLVGSNSCSAPITVLGTPPSPSPTPPPTQTPSPQSPPPSPPPSETITVIPNQCENAVETDKLTDNYITKPGTYDSPLEVHGIGLATGTLNQEVTIPLNVSFSVDFSKLQSLFGYQSSDYLEGRFQQGSHRDAKILELDSADFNNFHGPAQKTEPKYLSDLEKVKYVQYVYKKPAIAESVNIYTDVYGKNPMTVAQMVEEFGTPDPPQSGDRTAWLSGWGRYWEKIPTAYNELYLGKLEFAVIGSEQSFEDLKNGEDCAAISARTVEFIVPDFGRTTLVADQLNQVIVPYAAQSFRDHRTRDQGVGLGTPKNFLAKAASFCKKIITSPIEVVKSLQKVIKVSLNFLSPVKTVYAQDSEDGPTCIKILSPGKEGNAPYCALPPGQLQPGDSCANKISPNKLNTDNPNVVCTFQIGSITTTIGPANPFWDRCVVNGDGTYTCIVDKIRVYPNFRLPWIAEIWNSALYSDSNEAGVGSVEGAKTDEKGQVLQGETSIGIGSPQVSGRPGLYAAFIPKVLYEKIEQDKYAELQRLFEACPTYFGPIPDPNPDVDQEACNKLTSAYSDCIDIYYLDQGLRGQDLIDKVYSCVSDLVSRNLSGQSASGGYNDTRERFVGAVDCGKHYSRDVALKPKALQSYLGIGVTCNLQALAIPATEIPPGGTPPGGEVTPGEGCSVNSQFAKLLPTPIPPSAGAVSPQILSRLDTQGVISAALEAERQTGVMCEVLVGIHYIEGSWWAGNSFISGRPIGQPEPDVTSASACTKYGGTMTAGGCVFDTLQQTALYAAELIMAKNLAFISGTFEPPQNFDQMVGVMAAYNGLPGNANCGRSVPYTGPCPPPTGIDNSYAVGHFDSAHEKMYLIWCSDGVMCSPPKLFQRDGAATAAKEFFLKK